MNQQTIKQLAVFAAVLLGVVGPSHAQRMGTRQLSKVLNQRNFSRQVIRSRSLAVPGNFNPALGARGFSLDPSRSVREFDPLFGYKDYNPVLGYKTPLSAEALDPHNGTQGWIQSEEKWSLQLQVAPKTLRSTPVQEAFTGLNDLTLPQLTEAIYLWRLANPGKVLEEGSVIYEAALEKIKAETGTQITGAYTDEVLELPNITFLERLLDPSFTPKTYAQLALEYPVYPKHVTLNAQGFPVPTAQAQEAQLLDNYLMLSHPKVMGQYNSSRWNLSPNDVGYTGFVQTREEHLAAEQLLARRQEAYTVPENPTPRQLLEAGYNHMASHTVPYNSAAVADNFAHFAYLNYLTSPLAPLVERTLAAADGSVLRQSRDISHLIVLDAVMGRLNNVGPTSESFQVVYRALDAFEQLCRETPVTTENIQQLTQLKSSLLKSAVIWEVDDALVNGRSQNPIWNYFVDMPEQEVNQMLARLQAFKAKSVEDMMTLPF